MRLYIYKSSKNLRALLRFKIERINMFTDVSQMQKIMTNLQNEEVVIFDAGAFDGGTALIYKTLFPTSKTYSFEPFQKFFSELVKILVNIKYYNYK